jgi:threonine dehydrogenase-like Zn-dependent dehydrogenase
LSQLVLVLKEVQVRASFAYRREDFEEAVALLAAGKLPADRLVTDTVPLDRAQEMFDALEDPATEHIKVLLEPGQPA